MKKSLILTSLLVSAISFNGCGGGGSSGGDGSSGGSGNGNGGATLTPVTTNVVCDPAPLSTSKINSDLKYAADGDITVECKTLGAYTIVKYKLVEGVDTLTILDMKKVEEVTLDSAEIKGKGTDTYDYKAGTIHHETNIVYKGKRKQYNCIETYPSPLPSSLTDTLSIDILFDWDEENNNRISTTCPASYYDDNDNEDEDIKGKVTIITNYTLTDSNAKTHLVTKTINATYK